MHRKRSITVLLLANFVSLELSLWTVFDEYNLIYLGMACGQAAMLGSYLASAYQPFAVRIRWFFRLFVAQWICLMLPILSESDRLHWQFPWCVLADQLLVASPAFLIMGALRSVCRLGVLVDNNAPLLKSNFRILDLIIMTTLVAIMIGISMRFSGVPMGLQGLLYAVMIVGGIFVGVPIGFILPLLLAGFLAARKRTVVLTTLLWLIVIGVSPFLLAYNNEFNAQERTAILAACAVGLSLALANTFALRWMGYRLRKLPLSQVISPPQE